MPCVCISAHDPASILCASANVHSIRCISDATAAGHIVKLRRAFEVADVDGDLRIGEETSLQGPSSGVMQSNPETTVSFCEGREELEIVLLSSNASDECAPADIDALWSVLNPTHKQQIGFLEFLHGMAAIDKRVSRVSHNIFIGISASTASLLLRLLALPIPHIVCLATGPILPVAQRLCHWPSIDMTAQ